MASAFGAGAGADMLQDVLRRKLQEQAILGQQRLAEQRMAQEDAYRQASLASMQGARDDAAAQHKFIQEQALAKQAEQESAQATAKNQAQLRAAIAGSQNVAGTDDPNGSPGTRNALRVALTASGAKPNEIPQESVAPKPKLYAVTVPGPNGPMHKLVSEDQMQQGVQGYKAPTAPAQTHARFNIVQGADANGKPAMIRTNVDTGEIEVLPVPAGANFVKRDQPATADQTNLAIYSSRIAQAEPTIKSLESAVARMNPLSFEAQARVDKPYLQSKEMQSYSQAARQFVNSVLRRESGAAISQSEFDSARKQYLPMPGDTPQVLAQKAAARADVIAQFQRGAGPAAQRQSAPANDSAAKAAELLKKYGGG